MRSPDQLRVYLWSRNALPAVTGCIGELVVFERTMMCSSTGWLLLASAL